VPLGAHGMLFGLTALLAALVHLHVRRAVRRDGLKGCGVSVSATGCAEVDSLGLCCA
jgi:hypothetical protein